MNNPITRFSLKRGGGREYPKHPRPPRYTCAISNAFQNLFIMIMIIMEMPSPCLNNIRILLSKCKEVEIHSFRSHIRDQFVWSGIHAQNSGIHSQKSDSNHYFAEWIPLF